MGNDFLYNLSRYMREHDTGNAARTVMSELGTLMVRDRENFVLILKFAGLPANDAMSDAELIRMFVDNAQSRKLLVSAAFFVNQQNKKVGFDGEEEISDPGVKAAHRALYNHFDAYKPAEVVLYSNAGGAIAGAIDSVAKLGGKIVDQRRAKTSGMTDALQKREEAQQAMAMAALKQRQAQQAALIKKQQDAARTKKILLWSGVGLAGAVLVTGVIIYVVKRRRG